MSKRTRFWRNVILIGLAHLALIVGLIRWSREPKIAPGQSLVWMNTGGAGDGETEKKAVKSSAAIVSTPAPEEEPKGEPEEERPVLTSAKSEIALPSATPKPTPKTTPKPSVTPKPKPKESPTPKATPKPKTTPKPKKKTVLAKASPKPKPKIKPTPEKSDEDEEKQDVNAEKKRIAKATLAKNDATDDAKSKKAIAAHEGAGKGNSAGAGGHEGGAGGASQFGWYGEMLHDRFHSEWIQPTTEVSSGEKISVLVKIRIEKDGSVSQFEVIKPSGNAIVDGSVAAVAKRVTQVDALPDGLGSAGHYDVKINFELNSEQ